MKYCICAIVKNEHLFIKEWADYHLNIGFDHIYIFEDYRSDSHKSIFEGYDNVTVTPLSETPIKDYKSTKTQESLYNWFLRNVKENNTYDWCAFIDIDEFIMFEDGYNLQKLCEEFKDYPGIWLSWKTYNANGHIKRPVGKVLENYTLIAEPDEQLKESNQWLHKSLVNLNVAERLDTLHTVLGGVRPNFNNNKHSDQCYEKAWINHYYCKSFEDYCVRIFERGNMQNNFRSFDQFFEINKDFRDKEVEILESVRYRHTFNTMYISKKHKIISGGNVYIINKLNNTFHKN